MLKGSDYISIKRNMMYINIGVLFNKKNPPY